MSHHQLNRITPSKYTFRGIVRRIVSHDEHTGYAVLKVSRATPYQRIEQVIAYLPKVYVGTMMEFDGRWIFTNGPVFHADYVYEIHPHTLTEVRRYLMSGFLSGIRKQMIKKVVKHFKQQTMDVFNHEIERLSEVPGITNRNLPKIITSWKSHQSSQESMTFLQRQGFKGAFAVQIFQKFGTDAINHVKSSPYHLLGVIDGLNFPTVDRIGLSMGIREDDIHRIRAGILYAFSQKQDQGHCYLTVSDIYSYCKGFLNVDMAEKGHEILRDMCGQQLLKAHGFPFDDCGREPLYYLPSIFDDELYVAQKIANNNVPPQVDISWIRNRVNSVRVSRMRLSEEQRTATIGIVSSKYAVLTGGAGTGKTATLKSIIDILTAMGRHVLLAAPTGRAAQRMTEMTGIGAQTIHRLLGWDGKTFKYDENNLIQTDFLIVDEASMLDICLTAALLRAIPDHSQILLVGDRFQLPAIGPGNVLHDLLFSGVVPAYRLTQIFRQAEGSSILEYANQVIRYQVPQIPSFGEITMERQTAGSCFFMEADTSPRTPTYYRRKENLALNHMEKQPKPCNGAPYDHEMCADDVIRDLHVNVIPQQYGNAGIQILTPFIRGSLGTIALNRVIQEAFNPFTLGKGQLKIGNRIFRAGDRVIQCQNNYHLDVFNGEIGFIKDIDSSDLKCTVEYPMKRVVRYTFDDLHDLDLAYAITIHKAQGSEFDVVIIPIPEPHMKIRLLNRELIYTAMTRAKRLSIFVGGWYEFDAVIKNQRRYVRQTALTSLLRSMAKKRRQVASPSPC